MTSATVVCSSKSASASSKTSDTLREIRTQALDILSGAVNSATAHAVYQTAASLTSSAANAFTSTISGAAGLVGDSVANAASTVLGKDKRIATDDGTEEGFVILATLV